MYIDDEPSLHEVVSEDVVHECLEGGWRIALAKKHHHRFIEPVRSSESSLPLVDLLYPNAIMYTPTRCPIW